MKFASLYNKYYRKMFFLPVILLIAALVIIGHQYATTGDFIGKDVSLKGGITATLYTNKEIPNLKESLANKFPSAEIDVKYLSEFGTQKQIGIIIEASSDLNEKDLTAELSKYFDFELTDENYSVEFAGSVLGGSFYKQMMIAIGLSFLFMAIVVFAVFRSFIPSLNVVFAAFSDIVITIGILDLFGFKFSTAGISALLLLIGYSIDTDIVITTKVLKRRGEGDVVERLIDGISTGLTMTATTIAAVTVGYIFSTSGVLREIFVILIIGLIVDIISTYMMNAGLLIEYARRKNVN